MSELIFIILLIICLVTIFFLHYYLNKRGLIFASVILNMLSFILNFKITTIFKMNVNMGIVAYISLLTVLYIYIIKYGKKETKDIIIINFITSIITAIIITIMSYCIPAITETISINMEGTFEYNYKILIAYPIISLLSQYCVIKLYSFVSSLQSNNIISLMLTNIITGVLYTIIFYTICYINILSVKASIFISVTTYIIGLIVTIINIVFIELLIDGKKVAK